MRRADRLFQIIQILRTRSCVTAEYLADELQVSVRTIYRDMQDLSLSGVPVLAQTGVGYQLDRAYNLPSITFSENELQALLLGARMVQAWSDRQLAREASFAISRIESILPESLKQTLRSRDIQVPAYHIYSSVADDMPVIRDAIRQSSKVHLDYRREDGEVSSRVVWPLGLFFWGQVWTMVSWCELRNEFRQFRLDRINKLTALAELFSCDEHQSLDYYLQQVCSEDEP